MKIEITNLTSFKISPSVFNYLKKSGEEVLKKLKLNKNVELSVVFVSDAQMRNLNRRYRGENKTTDVISFTYQDHINKSFLGEIFISYQQASKQTQKKGYPLKRELTLLFVHGILHLVGYEDETEKGYRAMMKKQDEIINLLFN